MTVVREVRMIDKVTRVGGLYDCYANLLTERQRQMLEMYYFDDWSLAEIAVQLGVSRQAVHDNLHRAEDQLEGYESALGILRDSSERMKLLQEFSRLWSEVEACVPEAPQLRLRALLQALTEKERQ